jgi:hypothetical protein
MADAVKMNPHHGITGRHPTKLGLDRQIGDFDPGMFGRMFRGLAPLVVPDTALEELAESMKDPNPNDLAGNNPNIPAGYTYLGQFVDHDITLDLTSLSEKERDPEGIQNFRSPGLDLDSIYGRGPDGSPHLYARNPRNGNMPGPKFLIGATIRGFNSTVPQGFPNDLPRGPQGIALIGDHRNDENLVVAQTHLAFLKFHNKVVDMLAEGPNLPSDLFAEARKIVTWHYQWMILHDFVERLTEDGIVARILHDGRKFYRFRKYPYMPVEFSAAVYRLGHSMVREVYAHNSIFCPTAIPPIPATLASLFHFSGLSGGLLGNIAPDPMVASTPARLLPSNWIIDWRRYYDFRTPKRDGFFINSSRKIDPFLAPMLHELPGGGGSLPLRNLRRGVLLGLPSGQDVAAEMGIKEPLTPDELSTGDDGKVAMKHGMHLKTPLWYYVLKEAQQRRNGERLGPLGARIVAEVFVGLVHGDHESYLWRRGKYWKPELPSKIPGRFTMVDLLQFVGEVSPIDGIQRADIV